MSGDSTQHLVHMANQIADAFIALPQDEAVKSIANHIKSFWAPVMRNRLLDYAATHGSELKPLALKGLEALKAQSAAGAKVS